MSATPAGDCFKCEKETEMKDNKYGTVTLEKKPDAPADEPCFVLRAQDPLASIAVRYYAELIAGSKPGIAGKNDAERIRDIASAMTSWPVKKLPSDINT